MQLKHISNHELLERIKTLVKDERKINLEILHHLREIESRQLFQKMGFPSLFDYALKELGYSESAAYRRISAMRLLKEIPQVEEKIANGSLSLSAATQVQSFFKAEKKQNKIYTTEEKLNLIENIENKSTREVEKQLVELSPQLISAEKIRQLTSDKVEIKIVIDEKLLTQLDQLKLKLSHINPEMSYAELLQYLVDRYLKEPTSSVKRHKATPAPEVTSSRYIPRALKTKIWQRDEACCSYVDPVSKRKCGSRFQLQYDHIKPFALGGCADEANLRLLCAAHNRWRAAQTFPRKTR